MGNADAEHRRAIGTWGQVGGGGHYRNGSHESSNVANDASATHLPRRTGAASSMPSASTWRCSCKSCRRPSSSPRTTVSRAKWAGGSGASSIATSMASSTISASVCRCSASKLVRSCVRAARTVGDVGRWVFKCTRRASVDARDACRSELVVASADIRRAVYRVIQATPQQAAHTLHPWGQRPLERWG